MYSLISLFVWKKKYKLFKFSSLSKPLVSWLFFRVDFLIYFIFTHIIYLLHVPFICNQISILVTTFILDFFCIINKNMVYYYYLFSSSFHPYYYYQGLHWSCFLENYLKLVIFISLGIGCNLSTYSGYG